jgi:hypothetical protein
MHDNDGQTRLHYRGAVTARPQGLVAKTLSVVLGVAVVVSAFVVSIAFFAVAAVLVLAFGGYLWWKTRDLRRQLREQMQEGLVQGGPMQDGNVTQEFRPADSPGDVIEGVVVSRKETSEQPRH